MIDFHSHILPCIDDGSKSVEESVALLRGLCEQGVDCVCATPHFYAERSIPERFCMKREASYSHLINNLGDSPAPKIILGAEVAYFAGICEATGIERLSFSDSNVLLLEMPFTTWSDYNIRELLELALSRKCTVIIAHIERYLDMQKRNSIRMLLDNGVLMQANASFFINRKTRRRALGLLGNGDIQLLGSDCHNISSRPPRIGEAISLIRKKLGEEFVENMNAFGESILCAGTI